MDLVSEANQKKKNSKVLRNAIFWSYKVPPKHQEINIHI